MPMRRISVCCEVLNLAALFYQADTARCALFHRRNQISTAEKAQDAREFRPLVENSMACLARIKLKHSIGNTVRNQKHEE